MLDINQAYVGQRVRMVSLEPSWNLPFSILNREGVITHLFPDHLLVMFGELNGQDRCDYYCATEHLAALPISPEEEARHQQERQRQEDQQRRQAHADKYL